MSSMSLRASGPSSMRVIAVAPSVPAINSSRGSLGTHRLVTAHTTGNPASRAGRTRSANPVSRSAHCTSSIAISTGVWTASSSSNALIRSTSHSGLSYSGARLANASPGNNGWGPDRSDTNSGAPGAIWSPCSAFPLPTLKPARDACSTTSRSTADLPMPGSPLITTRAPCPVRAARSNADSARDIASLRPLSATRAISLPSRQAPNRYH